MLATFVFNHAQSWNDCEMKDCGGGQEGGFPGEQGAEEGLKRENRGGKRDLSTRAGSGSRNKEGDNFFYYWVLVKNTYLAVLKFPFNIH